MHHRTTSALRSGLAGALLAVAAGAGCGGSKPAAVIPSPVPAAEDACLVRSPGAPRTGELLVDSTLLARRLVDTPVRLDCTGLPRPGLASAWTRDSTGRAWTLTLPDAGAVARAWHESRRAAEALSLAGAESWVPIDDRRLVVTFRQPHDSLPTLFADPALGLARDSLAPTSFRALPAGGDARDAIDRGADLVRSADPTVLEYAASHQGVTVVPLPWDRTYILVLPDGSRGLGPIAGADTAGFRAALAGDAVRPEARGAEPPFWWTTARCDPATTTHSSVAPRSSALLYSRDDAVARALAARLVAMSDTPDAIVRAVEPAQLTAALRAGIDLGYVVAVPRRDLVPCRTMAAWPPGATVLALIDTRSRLVMRDGVPPLEVEYDGALRIVSSP
jgi:hypothetical protein